MKDIETFFIGVIGKEESICRRYSNIILALCKVATKLLESAGYRINVNRHDSKREQLISESIVKNIVSADMFFVLADYPFWNPNGDNNFSNYQNATSIYWGYNPNVWFEYGLAATTNKAILMIKCSEKELPFNSHEIHAVDIVESQIKYLFTHLPNLSNNASAEEVYTSVKSMYEKNDPTIVGIVDDIQKELISRLEGHVNPFQYMMLEGAARHLGFKSIIDLLKSVSGVQFIDGENASFKALIEDVKLARSAIYSTRFANQSIVNSSNSAHSDFMSNLLDFSKKTNTVSERIICNNSIKKWIDVHKAVSNLVHVYVRGNDYSAHFELVIIDEHTTFIHFYDKSISNTELVPEPEFVTDTYNKTSKVERINSTLRISANPDVCKKLLGVFQRHYRKSTDNGNQVFSQTILGVIDEIPFDDSCEYVGSFCLDQNILEESRSNSALLLLIRKYKAMVQKYNDWRNETDHGRKREKIKALTAKDIWRMYYGINFIAKSIYYPLDESFENDKPLGSCPQDISTEYERILKESGLT